MDVSCGDLEFNKSKALTADVDCARSRFGKEFEVDIAFSFECYLEVAFLLRKSSSFDAFESIKMTSSRSAFSSPLPITLAHPLVSSIPI